MKFLDIIKVFDLMEHTVRFTASAMVIRRGRKIVLRFRLDEDVIAFSADDEMLYIGNVDTAESTKRYTFRFPTETTAIQLATTNGTTELIVSTRHNAHILRSYVFQLDACVAELATAHHNVQLTVFPLHRNSRREDWHTVYDHDSK